VKPAALFELELVSHNEKPISVMKHQSTQNSNPICLIFALSAQKERAELAADEMIIVCKIPSNIVKEPQKRESICFH